MTAPGHFQRGEKRGRGERFASAGTLRGCLGRCNRLSMHMWGQALRSYPCAFGGLVCVSFKYRCFAPAFGPIVQNNPHQDRIEMPYWAKRQIIGNLQRELGQENLDLV